MSPIEKLDTAEAALEKLQSDLSELESLRDRFDTEANEIDERLTILTAALAEKQVDVALGLATAKDTDILRTEIATLTTAHAEKLGMRDAADRRAQALEKAEPKITADLQRATGSVALPIYNAARERVRDAFRAFCEAQADWIAIAKVGGDATPLEGHCYVRHGTVEDPDSLDAIASAAGLYPDTFAPQPARIPALSRDELRARASKTH